MSIATIIRPNKLNLDDNQLAQLRRYYDAGEFAEFNDLIITETPARRYLELHSLPELIKNTAQALSETRLGEEEFLDEFLQNIDQAAEALSRENSLPRAAQAYFSGHRDGPPPEFDVFETEVADFNCAVARFGDLVGAAQAGYRLALVPTAEAEEVALAFYKSAQELSQHFCRCLAPILGYLAAEAAQ